MDYDPTKWIGWTTLDEINGIDFRMLTQQRSIDGKIVGKICPVKVEFRNTDRIVEQNLSSLYKIASISPLSFNNM